MAKNGRRGQAAVQPVSAEEGPGQKHVGPAGVVVSFALLIGVAALVLYVMLKVWPNPGAPASAAVATAPAAGDTVAPATSDSITVPSSSTEVTTTAGAPVTLFGRSYTLWSEQRLLLLVLLGGALGGLVHAIRSMAWYIGNRELVWSWLAYYLALPFSGALLAAVFYLIVRGGFFNPDAQTGGSQETSPFGFTAFAVIVGMFSTQAALKLKEVAETILSKPVPGRETAPSQSDGAKSPAAGATPSISRVERLKKVDGGERDALVIHGVIFSRRLSLKVNDVARAHEFRTSGEIVLPLTAEDLKEILAANNFELRIVNPGNRQSEPYAYT